MAKENENIGGGFVLHTGAKLPKPEKFAGAEYRKVGVFQIGASDKHASAWLDISDARVADEIVKAVGEERVKWLVVLGFISYCQSGTTHNALRPQITEDMVEGIGSGNGVVKVLSDLRWIAPAERGMSKAEKDAERARIHAAVKAGEMDAVEALEALAEIDNL